MSRLVLLAAFGLAAQEPVVPQPAAPAAPGGMPPRQMVASIDPAGQLRLTWVTPSPCAGPGGREGFTAPVPMGGKSPAKVPVKVTTLLVTTVELEAKHVAAYAPDGRAIPADKLAGLLSKERPVLVALDGKKVDPFLLQLYKEDTIVLVPPADAIPGGQGQPGGFGVPQLTPVAPGAPLPFPGPGAFPKPEPIPAPGPGPDEKKK
jgi:hypothetical protein